MEYLARQGMARYGMARHGWARHGKDWYVETICIIRKVNTMNELIKNKRKSEILAEAFATMKYGDVLKHEGISDVIDEPYPSGKYMSIVQSAKKVLLRDYGKALESIHGDGYRVIEPDDFVKKSLTHYKRGFKEFQKGSNLLEHAPINDMTQEGREIYNRVNDRATILHASIKGAVVELKTLGEKRHPFLPQNIQH